MPYMDPLGIDPVTLVLRPCRSAWGQGTRSPRCQELLDEKKNKSNWQGYRYLLKGCFFLDCCFGNHLSALYNSCWKLPGGWLFFPKLMRKKWSAGEMFRKFTIQLMSKAACLGPFFVLEPWVQNSSSDLLCGKVRYIRAQHTTNPNKGNPSELPYIKKTCHIPKTQRVFLMCRYQK